MSEQERVARKLQRSMPPKQPTGYYCANCGEAVTDQRRTPSGFMSIRGYEEVIRVDVENLPCGHVWQCEPGGESQATR